MTPIKTFTFQFDIDAVPYNEDTAKTIYGSFNPDFSEEINANDFASGLIQDALGFVSFMKRKFLSGKSTSVEKLNVAESSFWAYLNEKEQRYIKAQESLKLSKNTKN